MSWAHLVNVASITGFHVLAVCVAVTSQKALAQYFCGNVTFVLEYLHHDFLRITFEFSVSKTTLRTTKLPSSRVLRLQQAQTKNSYRYGR